MRQPQVISSSGDLVMCEKEVEIADSSRQEWIRQGRFSSGARLMGAATQRPGVRIQGASLQLGRSAGGTSSLPEETQVESRCNYETRGAPS